MEEALIMQQVTDLQSAVDFLTNVLIVFVAVTGIGMVFAFWAISKVAHSVTEIDDDLESIEDDVEELNKRAQAEDIKEATDGK